MDTSYQYWGEVVKDYLVKKILKDSYFFLLGLDLPKLSWYNIIYDNFNVKDLSVYKMDFYGKNDVSVLGYNHCFREWEFKARNNYIAYDNCLWSNWQARDLFNYLEGYRQLFLP